MDLETENRIAAILLKEAAELRRQAETEGVHVYLEQPKVRGRPNSWFLTATVLGLQQGHYPSPFNANRAVEVNEMWRVRLKELELSDKLKGRSNDQSSCSSRDIGNTSRNSSKRHVIDDNGTIASCSSVKRECESNYSREDEGLRDEEVEEFLHSRVKRGRGAVGSRMDETGPYLAPSPNSNDKLSSRSDVAQQIVLGPKKHASLKYYESSDEEHHDEKQKTKKERLSNSDKHSRKHKSKEKSRYEEQQKRKRGEKRSNHHQ